MQEKKISVLGYALLGLLYSKPSSGYDLRKLFARTPLRTFSDSPGAIYPALRRLEESGLIQGQVEDGSGMRRRKIYRLSKNGVAALKKWMSHPVTGEDVIRNMDELLLRFAFMDAVIEKSALIEFLRALERELKSYIPTLREYLKREQSKMPVSGRLALESGIRGYEAQLRWVRDALATYGSPGPEG
ncbi:MAG TPA: PadR family transcriptional regulator [Blastocatellia bacterium]|nr:PadR family transcriptional regulator [Blastocatellia bacterium]